MDLSNPTVLFSQLLIGLVGLALFLYGRKSDDLKCVGCGLAVGIFPYFVHSILMLWGLTGLCLLGLFLASRQH